MTQYGNLIPFGNTRNVRQSARPGNYGARPEVGNWDRVQRYYDQVHTQSAANWPRGLRKNPYKFAWPGEECRDMFLHLLLTPPGGRTRYPVKDLLRFMLLRFRIAEPLKSNPLPDMRRFRWRWFSNQELAQWLQQDERQLRDELRFLIDRGLVVRVYEAGRTKFPYYRPSDDLFRVCLGLTKLSDLDYLCAFLQTDRVFPTEHRTYSDACRRIFTDHAGELHRLLAEFVESDQEDRARTFYRALHPLLEAVWPEGEEGIDFQIGDEE